MSAEWSFLDFMGFLDLINTPYPNQPYGNTEDEFFGKLAECIDTNNRAKFVFLARQFVLFNAGDLDADKGKKLHDYLNQFVDKNYPNRADTPRNNMRRAIWGDGKECGKSYNNYQPCFPLWNKYCSLKGWSADLDKWRRTHGKLDQQFTDARIKLSDQIQKKTFNEWHALAIAERLHCPYGLLVSGLRGEF